MLYTVIVTEAERDILLQCVEDAGQIVSEVFGPEHSTMCTNETCAQRLLRNAWSALKNATGVGE